MKYLIALFLMPICLFASVKVAIVGDSISVGTGASAGHGYVDVLMDRLDVEGHDVEIINRSYGGAMTDTIFQITVTLLTQERPDYIIYFIGINDCGMALNSGWSPDQLQGYLTTNFSDTFKKARGLCKIIIGGITCAFAPPYDTALEKTYSTLITNFNCYPTMLLSREVLSHSKDKIHPDDKGAEMIANTLYKALRAVGAFSAVEVELPKEIVLCQQE